MFHYSQSAHWSFLSGLFYVCLGLLAVWGVYYSKKNELESGRIPSLKNKYLFAWWFVWVFVAVCRLVDWHVGGADAPSYIYYFENCNSFVKTSWFDHVESDLGFKWLNKIIRFISGDYHVYFLVIYGFMVYAYVRFLKDFSSPKTNYAPYVFSFFLLLRGFSSIRSNFTIALIALGCVFIIEKKWTLAYIFAFSSLLFHKSAVMYAMCVPFCHYFQNRKLNLKVVLLIIVASSLVGRTFQSWFVSFARSTDLNGAYASYASRSIGTSFFQNGWKIAFDQLALGALMLYSWKKIGRNHPDWIKARLNIIVRLCIFDLALVPMNFILGSWRGYEYFLLARIVMWGECFYQLFIFFKKEERLFASFLVAILFILWMLSRIDSTLESSHLVPYVFEPFMMEL